MPVDTPTGPTRPDDIEALSFAIIDAEVPEPRPFSGPEWSLVRRLIHTTADFELPALVRLHPRAVAAGVAALAAGATLVTDTEMARVGIPRRRVDRLGCRVVSFMNDPEVAARAGALGRTRAYAAVDRALEVLGDRNLIFVIGNAPTALFRLLQRIEAGAPAPALIIGMPVGFVNAAESKEALMAQDAIPYVTISGRKGGSTLAAATVNALAELALADGGMAG